MPTSSPTFWAQCVCADLSCRSDLYCARVGDAPTSELAHPLQAQRYLCIASSVQDILQCLAGSRFVHLCYELRRGKQGVARRPQFQAFGVFLEIFWIGGHPQASRPYSRRPMGGMSVPVGSRSNLTGKRSSMDQ